MFILDSYMQYGEGEGGRGRRWHDLEKKGTESKTKGIMKQKNKDN